jgi:hypothetical protein
VSIHHEVSVHCDRCGHWEHGNVQTTAQRRQAGWVIWTSQGGRYGRRLHLCPTCIQAGAQETVYGEVAPSSTPATRQLDLLSEQER